MKDLKKISDLKPGDIVRGKISHRTFRVIAVYGDRATGVETQDITNAHEWEVLTIEEQVARSTKPNARIKTR